MNLLVTGGAGFIGAHFVRTVLAGDHPDLHAARVTVLDKLTYAGSLARLSPIAGDPALRFVRGDVADAELIDKVLPGHDAIVHFAAETHVDRSITAATDFTITNVVGTQVLLDAALRHRTARFVHISTDEVYGSVAAGARAEDAALAPSSPYAASKAAADLLALAYHRTHELPVTIVRCANNYGPYQHPEKLIPRFVTTLLDDGMVPLYGDGHHVRDWVHVNDNCHGVALVLANGRAGEVYHVGGRDERTNRQVTELLLATCGAGWDRVQHVADRKGHDRRYALDDTKIRTELGYAPRVDYAAGIADTVAWYRDNRAWWQPLLADVPPV